MGIEIRSLAGIDFDTIADGFLSAFADYDIVIDRSQLKAMLTRRGFCAELSFAAFDGDRIAAFTFNGLGTHGGVTTAYDTGTGTVAEYRGQGLAGRIFEYSVPFLRDAGVKQYLLEVLQQNTPAINIYRKQGFEVTRKFNCYRCDSDEIVTAKANDAVELLTVTTGECRRFQQWHDFMPSWQNGYESIDRAGDTLIGRLACVDGRRAGYCILEPATGDVVQIAVDPSMRRRGVASALLRDILDFNAAQGVKVVNTDMASVAIDAFLTSVGLKLGNKQFEMVKMLR